MYFGRNLRSFPWVKASFKDGIQENYCRNRFQNCSRIDKGNIEFLHPYYVIILGCKDLIARDWEVVVKHIFKECNKVADYRANMSHILNIGVHWFEKALTEAKDFIFADFMGFTPLIKFLVSFCFS